MIKCQDLLIQKGDNKIKALVNTSACYPLDVQIRHSAMLNTNYTYPYVSYRPPFYTSSPYPSVPVSSFRIPVPPINHLNNTLSLYPSTNMKAESPTPLTLWERIKKALGFSLTLKAESPKKQNDDLLYLTTTI